MSALGMKKLRSLLFVIVSGFLFLNIFSTARAAEIWTPGNVGDGCTAAEISFQQNYGAFYGDRPFRWCKFTAPNFAINLHRYYDYGLELGGNGFISGCTSSNQTLTEAACLKVQPKGPQMCTGNPIDVLSGDKIQRVLDFETSGPDPLRFERIYTSATRDLTSYFARSLIGRGWRSNFDVKLYIGYAATAVLPDGSILPFVVSNGQYVPAKVGPDSITTNPASGGYSAGMTGVRETLQIVGANLVLRSEDGDKAYVFEYNAGGYNYTPRLLSIKFRGGYTQTMVYDANNVMTGVTDNRGRSLSFTYSTAGVISDVSSGGVIVAHFDYIPRTDPAPLVPYYPTGVPAEVLMMNPVIQTVTYPTANNQTETYWYEDNVNRYALTGITDGRGIRYATWAYDAQGRGISSQHAGGAELTAISYDTVNKKAIITNPLNKQEHVSYAISPKGRFLPTSLQGQASANCPLSNSTMAYDANDWMSQHTDAEGRVTTYVNDPTTGLPSSMTRGYGTPGAVTTTYTWNAAWRVPTQIVEPGITTSFNWDADGKLLSLTKTDTTSQTVPYSTNGQARTSTYTYNTNGLLLTASGPLAGATVTYTYDTAGAVKTITNEMGKVTTVNATNSRGQPTSITDANGILTALGYDGRGRLTSVSVDTANGPATTTIAYDAAGQVTSVTNPIGAVQTLTWDNARRLTQIANNTGETITYTRDAMGNATSVTVKNPSAVAVYSKTQTFDELGRLIKSVGAVAANSSYSFTYDKTDNLTSVKDPRSYIFSYGFDALNRVITETDELSAAVTLTYNGTDKITAYKDPRNITTSYIRNGFGEIIREVSPDKGTTTYVRDVRGLVTQRTDPRSVVTNYTYDNAGRLTAKAYVGQSAYYASYTWDATAVDNKGIGQLVGISDESGISWRAFDGKGRIWIDYRTNYPASAKSVSYTRNAAGHVTSMTYPSGRIVTYARDALGRVSGVTTKQNTAAAAVTLASSMTWQPFGGLKSFVFGNGLTATYGVDSDYRINSVGVRFAPSGTQIINRSLTWTGETLDKITDTLDATRTETLTYTKTHRLSAAVGKYGTFGWTYDTVGNRTSESINAFVSTYAYPATNNRLTSITPTGQTARAFTYDAAGNVLTDSRTGALGMTFQYDVEGRLSKTFQTSNTLEGATYKYDARSRLASRVVTHAVAPLSTTTLYIHDLDDHIIAETDASGTTLREYIWVDDLPLAVVANANVTPAIYYVHTDHLLRPARMTDNLGAVAWDVIYKPFGEVNNVAIISASTDLRFPGQWFQLEAGLHYNWHRHYDPTTGRYNQPDPLGLTALRSDGPSAYAYVGGSPLVYTDPSGEAAGVIIGNGGRWAIGRIVSLFAKKTGDAGRMAATAARAAKTVADYCPDCKSTTPRAQALAAARAWAGMPTDGAGFTPRGWDQLNPPGGASFKKGPVWADFRKQNGSEPYFGYNSTTGAGSVEEHPFGHPDLPGGENHNCPHFVAVNSNGEAREFPYKPGT